MEQLKDLIGHVGKPRRLSLRRLWLGEVQHALHEAVDAIDLLRHDAGELLGELGVVELLGQIFGEGLDRGQRVLISCAIPVASVAMAPSRSV